ncbi:phage terminase large subunit family protein [Citrobacter sp. CK191]|nr:phage terminase large subunit family protein [Citrobacter sp. CK191]MDM3008088.1 phage terminase large subunit family protein [Citrobacter sp. CK191]
MATHRPARPDVGETSSLPDVRGMNFYVLMESLYRRYGGADREPSLRTEPEREVALFKSDASIAFPGSDLSTLVRCPDCGSSWLVYSEDAPSEKPLVICEDCGKRFRRHPVSEEGGMTDDAGMKRA